jgi:hypothetical protein
MPTRPSHPAPNTRDDREAPLLAEAGRADTTTYFRKTEAEYFSHPALKPPIDLEALAKLNFRRRQSDDPKRPRWSLVALWGTRHAAISPDLTRRANHLQSDIIKRG